MIRSILRCSVPPLLRPWAKQNINDIVSGKYPEYEVKEISCNGGILYEVSYKND